MHRSFARPARNSDAFPRHVGATIADKAVQLWFVLAVLGIALAQTPTQPAKGIIGEVTAVDGASKQITVKADGGLVYTVRVEERASLLRIPPGETDLKKATSIALSDVSAGDRVLARGLLSEAEKSLTARTIVVMSKSDLAKKQQDEQLAWQAGVAGIVSAVNADSKEITLAQRGANAKGVVIDAAGVARFLRYAPGSYQFGEAKPGSLADIKPGDTLRARGEKNEDGTRLKADQILSGAFQTVAGTVVSVEPAQGVLKIADLRDKKQVEVKLTAETMSRRMPKEMAAMMVRRANRSGGATAPGAAPGDASIDLHQALERLPPMPISEIKPGDALIISSTQDSSSATITAITLVAGVEPFLAAAPRSAGQVNLGSWSLDVPVQ